MSDSAITFLFSVPVSMPEVEATLHLARLAVESLHGEDRVAQETMASVDRASRTCVIDATREVGRTLALVFGGYVRREFGDDAVRMLRAPLASGRELARTGA